MLLREAFKNVWGGSKLTLTLVVAVAVAVAGAVISRVELSNFLEAEEERASSGHYVLVISSAVAEEPATIARASCDSLVADPRVARAGVAINDGEIFLMPLGRSVPLVRASETLVPDAYERDGGLGSRLSDTSRSTALAVDGRRLVASALPEYPEGIDVNSSLVLPLAEIDMWADTCLVVAKAGTNMHDLAPQLAASVSAQGGPVVASTYVRPWVDAVGAYLLRPGPAITTGSGILVGVLVGVSNTWRGSELALYRVTGTSRRSLLALLLLEIGTIATTYLAVELVSALVLTPGWTYLPGWLATSIGSALAVFVVGTLISSAVIFRSSARLLADR